MTQIGSFDLSIGVVTLFAALVLTCVDIMCADGDNRFLACVNDCAAFTAAGSPLLHEQLGMHNTAHGYHPANLLQAEVALVSHTANITLPPPLFWHLMQLEDEVSLALRQLGHHLTATTSHLFRSQASSPADLLPGHVQGIHPLSHVCSAYPASWQFSSLASGCVLTLVLLLLLCTVHAVGR
jgi:hypothetical protein